MDTSPLEERLRIAETLLAERDRQLQRATQQLPVLQSGFRDVRDRDGRLLFRYDARRALIQIKLCKGELTYIDLTEYSAT